MYIGIDLGGTTVKAGLVDQNGKILYQDYRLTNVQRGHQAIVNDIIDLIADVLKKSGTELAALESIGIGIPGLTDYKTGSVIYCTNLGWKNVPLAGPIQKHFNKPVYVENDATVAGLAESLFGSTKGVSNSVFLTLGTGIGAGIIINGKVYSGSHGAGSEIGHMIVGENFYSCNCGNNGCLETYASATAISKYAIHLIESTRKKTVLTEVCKGSINNINAKMVFDAAKSGDQLAYEVVSRMSKYLAIGIVNIYNVLDPDMIAIGGGVSKAGQYLLDELNKEINNRVFSCNVKYGDVVIAQLGNEAGIVGAAYLGV